MGAIYNLTPIFYSPSPPQGGGTPKPLEGDDDDAGSVTSERSTFSISSEVSVSPYSKYPNPISVRMRERKRGREGGGRGEGVCYSD